MAKPARATVGTALVFGAITRSSGFQPRLTIPLGRVLQQRSVFPAISAPSSIPPLLRPLRLWPPTHCPQSPAAKRWLASKCALKGTGGLISDQTQHDDEPEAGNWETTLQDLECKNLQLSSSNVELGQILTWLKAGRLNMFPEYQRDYVWDSEKASRLIVTILCNRFVPGVVFHELQKGKYDILDGKQRLCSILAWVLASEPGAEHSEFEHVRRLWELNMKNLRLDPQDHETYMPLHNLSFSDLSEDRKIAFMACSISHITVPSATPAEQVFELYEDINSGGAQMSKQQLRKAIKWGPYFKLLNKLAELPDFQNIYSDYGSLEGQRYTKDNEELDREFMLRAFAFANRWKEFKTPVKKFLNNEAFDNFDNEKYVKEQGDIFTIVMKIARSVFQNGAFRKWNDSTGKYSKTIDTACWDLTYIALSEMITEDKFTVADFLEVSSDLVEAHKKMCQHGVFQNYRPSIKQIKDRKTKLYNAFKNVMPEKDPKRAFTADIDREELYEKQKGLCSICAQDLDKKRIMETSYCEIDHINPHSKGGATTADNAGLAHKECNRRKGSKTHAA